MAVPSFPVTSQKAFNAFFTKAFAAVGAALVKTATAPAAPVTFTTASNPIRNDATRVYYTNSGTAQTVTIPQNLTAIAIGEEFTVTVLGAGVTTLAAGSGVTLNKLAATLKSNGQYSVIRVRKTAANVYVASGDLAAS